MIREENPQDLPEIRLVNTRAFGQADEAVLVDRLRGDGDVLLSLVADDDGEVVGHILFSRMWIDTASSSLPAVALAPLAVLPERQRLGVGGLLIQAGLDALRRQGESIVIVLGHPEYYPRFGFSTEIARTLKSPFRPECFMALELRPDALDGVEGRVRYPPAFGL